MNTILVLIVEDDVVDRMACRRRLDDASAGRFRLIEADEAERGLILARECRPDCILLDYRLPDLTGLDFLARLGADPDAAVRAIPVLMLTGADSAAVAMEAMRRGARDFLVKDAEGRYLELVPAAIERLQREQRLLKEKRQAEARFRTLVEQIQAITYVVAPGRADQLHYVSPQIGVLGYTPEEWLGDPGLYADRMLPDEKDKVFADVLRCREGGLPLRLEYRLRARTGEVLWFRDQADVVHDESGRPLFMQGTLIDITASKAAELKLTQARDELRHLAAYQEKIREDERRRIAREVHDELGGLLTGIMAYVSVIGERAALAGHAPDPLLEETAGLAQDAIDTVRRVIADLRPSVLDQLGIWTALEWYAAQVARRSSLACCCDIDPGAAALDIDPDRGIMLFRIVQEAMTNIQRHAQAREAWLRVRLADGQLEVAIEDDGCGMPGPAGPEPDDHWGILGMRERARSLGGELTVARRAGGGTVVALQVPVEARHAA
ncbi:PAS domain-containing protein [Telluria mixta]|uniref:PAS domain-containing protein n=1 Tax=Telluria mixta TaxID=34071 RepID=A0ABT2BSZ6_9BURK|nr:PAS domain-containing protein [Telluria mixta]MCS0628239.1 PAS domain-containing protein [Telluria mixta]WEM93647.1 PAS domain-containing protein [Telluria mixta]